MCGERWDMSRPFDYEPYGKYGSDRFSGSDFAGPFAEGARDGHPGQDNPYGYLAQSPLVGEPNPAYGVPGQPGSGYGAPVNATNPYGGFPYAPGSGRELLPHAAAYGQMNPALVRPKSHSAAALLAFFLGSTGAHNFYLGHNGRGAIQLILFVFGWSTLLLIVGAFVLFPLGLWAFVEFLLILFRSGSYGYDSRGVPLY